MTKARRMVNKNVRGFVIAWIAITTLVAGATFFAIYLTYGGGPTPTFAQNTGFPTPTSTEDDSTEVAAQVTVPPTIAVEPTQAPTEAPTEEPAPIEVEPTVVEESASEDMNSTSETRSDDTQDDDSGSTEVAMAQTDPTETPLPQPTEIPAIMDQSFQPGIQVQQALDNSQDTQDLWFGDVTQNLGLNWIKQQVRWEYYEPEPGEFQWGPLRRSIRSAQEKGANLMLSVVTAPEWALDPTISYNGKHGPPVDYQDFINFLTELVSKFGDDIDAIEIWNEQNLDREWLSTRGLNAQDYVNLLRRSYEAIKAINPNIIVISGALSPSGGWTEPDGTISAIDDFAYMDALIAAGMLDYADCVGAHHNGYNIGPDVTWDNVPNDPNATFRGPFDNPHHSWSLRSTLETYASKIALAGGDQKLCITEFGWASTEDLSGYPAGFEFANDNTLEEQARWTIQALDMMNSEWDFVWLAFIWNLNYGPQAGWDPTNDNVPYSIIGPEFNHRPVYSSIGQWTDIQEEKAAQGQ